MPGLPAEEAVYIFGCDLLQGMQSGLIDKDQGTQAAQVLISLRQVPYLFVLSSCRNPLALCSAVASRFVCIEDHRPETKLKNREVGFSIESNYERAETNTGCLANRESGGEGSHQHHGRSTPVSQTQRGLPMRRGDVRCDPRYDNPACRTQLAAKRSDNGACLNKLPKQEWATKS